MMAECQSTIHPPRCQLTMSGYLIQAGGCAAYGLVPSAPTLSNEALTSRAAEPLPRRRSAGAQSERQAPGPRRFLIEKKKDKVVFLSICLKMSLLDETVNAHQRMI